ncbi:hypothetical protein [Jiangella alba]|uniref:NHL repeat-containing protein n=1 Tax=Jiangella alba TaxID=561176 RepID=A0A1H5MXL6_9ACTN|nr:hypothetical protein [Jiangella alba]SEE94102.1 hypothetical protein SAMN04488561_3523 [Jiangella alba]
MRIRTSVVASVAVALTLAASSVAPAATPGRPAQSTPGYGIPATPLVQGIPFGYGVALGPDNSVYYAAFNGRYIGNVDATGEVSVAADYLECGVQRIAVSSQGDIYYTDGCFNVKKYDVDTKEVTVLATLTQDTPSGIAIGTNGNVFFTTESGTLREIVNGQAVTRVSGLAIPQGLAVDAAGNFYFGEYGNPNSAESLPEEERESVSGRVSRVSQSDWTPVVLASGMWRVRGVAEAGGKVYVIEEGNYDDQGSSGQLSVVPATGGARTVLLRDLDYPEGVAATSSGDVYFTSERGGGFHAGSMLFRYSPADSVRYEATNRGVTAHCDKPIRSLRVGEGRVEIRTSGPGSQCYVQIPADRVDWQVNTDLPLPMPGSWTPLPQILTTVGSRDHAVNAYVWMARAHEARRWPPTFKAGFEVMAPGFSEVPEAFIVSANTTTEKLLTVRYVEK